MKEKMNRRDFLKTSGLIGAAAVASGPLTRNLVARPLHRHTVDIASVQGANYFKNTFHAVDMLGGMNHFVSKNAKVGLLINSPWSNPGTFTNPDVALAVLKMCLDAGAKSIYSIEDAKADYWKRSAKFSEFEDAVKAILPSGGKDKKVEIPKGKKLKEALVSKAFMDCDVIINIPVVKDHSGTRFTCNLKNTMGACPHNPTNRFMHLGSGVTGFYDDPDHLSQCIADVNLIRTADLCVVDATEFVTTNGPRGPGEMSKPQKVVAGEDMVAVDAFCAKIRGLKPDDVTMIKMAEAHGMGTADLSNLNVQEKKI